MIHYSAHVRERAHPVRTPPQTRLEDTVLDLVETCDRAEDAVGLLTRACQRRLTTAARLGAAAARRKKLRWRRLVEDVLADVEDGVRSPLERRWARDVERAHGLPRGRRNRPAASCARIPPRVPPAARICARDNAPCRRSASWDRPSAAVTPPSCGGSPARVGGHPQPPGRP